MDRIVTTHVRPPIPVRDFDWSATHQGYEPGDPIGRGASEQEAIDDLVDGDSCECDLVLTLAEIDSGKCACCGKAVLR